MPIESRLLALAVLASAVALVAYSNVDPNMLRLALGTLLVAAVALLSPVVPVVHAVVAVFAGAILSATMIATGSLGSTAILLAPLPVLSLRFGGRPAAWSMALCAIGVLVLDPAALVGPLVVARGGSIAMFITAWLGAFLVVGFQAAEHPATRPSDRKDGKEPGPLSVSRPLIANI